MPRHPNKPDCRHRLYAGIWLPLIIASQFATPVYAEPPAPNQSLRPSVQLSATSYVEGSVANVRNYSTVGALFSLQPELLEGRLDAGLFADFELATGGSNRLTRIYGVWASKQTGRWTAASSVAFMQSGKQRGFWLQSGSISFSAGTRHQLGITLLAPLGQGGPITQLHYKTHIGQHFQIRIFVGLGANRLYDFAAMSRANWTVM